MTDTPSYEVPERGASDVAHALARAGVSSIPIVGALAAEIFQMVISPPLEKRRDKWMKEVGQALQDLEQNKGVRLEELQSNEVFVDTVLQASQIALRNSQEEKRQALRNAILNAALPHSPEQSLQEIFLGFIDVFTIWHLRLLNLFHEPALHPEVKEYATRRDLAGGLSIVLERAYPELKENRALYDQIWRDLYVRGLVTTEGLHTMMTGGGLLGSRTTQLGKSFLQFIQEPISL
jgi:hypothetical protein